MSTPDAIATASRQRSRQLAPGITRRPSGRYQAQAWSPRDKRRISKSFESLAAAKNWKRDTESSLAKGTLTAGQSPTLRQAAHAWLEAAEQGTVRNRSQQVYRSSTLRGYRRELEERLYRRLGATRLSDIRRGDLNQLIGELQGEGLSASTVRNILMPLRAIFRWAMDLEQISVNPTVGIQLPADRGRRGRVADPEEAGLLLATLPVRDRALWATALYAGLRRGELMALCWSDVDLGVGVIQVSRSHDPKAKVTGDPKSRAGTRRVPIPPVLRDHLVEHRMRARPDQALVFARSSLAGRRRVKDGPFSDSGVNQRARQAWSQHGIEPVTLHECRHTYASLMIAAEVGPKAIQTYLGHSSITTTFDRYGHLMPDAASESANRLQTFLDRADSERREQISAAESAAEPAGNAAIAGENV